MRPQLTERSEPGSSGRTSTGLGSLHAKHNFTTFGTGRHLVQSVKVISKLRKGEVLECDAGTDAAQGKRRTFGKSDENP